MRNQPLPPIFRPWQRRGSALAMVATILTVSLFYESCGGRRAPTTPSTTHEQISSHRNFERYVAACEAELGTPEKPARIPEIDCGAAAMVTLETGQRPKGNGGGCAAPSALLGAYHFDPHSGDNPCQQGSRILRQDVGDVTWITVCRKYQHYEDRSLYDDVNMIGYNNKNGKTCFFNSHVTGDTADKPLRFARPVSVYNKDAPAVFMSLEQIRDKVPCASCHAAHPFLRTPHILGAVTLPSLSAQSPYEIIWPSYFLPKGAQGVNGRLSADLIPALRSCTGCHAVGGGQYCSVYVPLAWGKLDPKLNYTHALADASNGPPSTLWHSGVMPRLRDVTDRETLQRHPAYKAAVTIMQACTAAHPTPVPKQATPAEEERP